MPIPFFDVSVAGFLQTVGATVALLEKASAHLIAQGVELESVVETSLYPDMKPLRFQIRSVAHHSWGAIEGLRSGIFSPPVPAPPYSYVQLQAMMVDTRDALLQVTPEEMEAFVGREVVFVGGDRRIPFRAENFILSFSVPNLHFHATTAYDILRHKGVPLEKRDYLGRLRFERGASPAA